MEYLPKSNEELLEWLKKFSDQLKTIGINLGITPAEISSLNALIMDVKDDIRNNRSDNETDAKKNSMLTFLNVLVVKLRKHPGFSSAQGKLLGIER